jgi:hypothetical protein
MTDSLKDFAEEMRRNDCRAEADVFEAMVRNERSGLCSRPQFLEALEQIASRTEHSFVERLAQVIRLAEIEMLSRFDADSLQSKTIN